MCVSPIFGPNWRHNWPIYVGFAPHRRHNWPVHVGFSQCRARTRANKMSNMLHLCGCSAAIPQKHKRDWAECERAHICGAGHGRHPLPKGPRPLAPVYECASGVAYAPVRDVPIPAHSATRSRCRRRRRNRSKQYTRRVLLTKQMRKCLNGTSSICCRDFSTPKSCSTVANASVWRSTALRTGSTSKLVIARSIRANLSVKVRCQGLLGPARRVEDHQPRYHSVANHLVGLCCRREANDTRARQISHPNACQCNRPGAWPAATDPPSMCLPLAVRRCGCSHRASPDPCANAHGPRRESARLRPLPNRRSTLKPPARPPNWHTTSLDAGRMAWGPAKHDMEHPRAK